MNVNKLLKSIVSPDLSDDELAKMKDSKKLASHLHTYTHGINSDPITMFAILFSAIIHDVVSVFLDLLLSSKRCVYIFLTMPQTDEMQDHPGVSNKQYAIENPMIGERYRNKSVAEQNSLDVAWDVLVDSHFREMREYMFETNDELLRF